MRHWYLDNFCYIPSKDDLVDMMVHDGYDRSDLESMDHELLLEMYWIEHS